MEKKKKKRHPLENKWVPWQRLIYQTWETRAVNMKGSQTHKALGCSFCLLLSVASGNHLEGDGLADPSHTFL